MIGDCCRDAFLEQEKLQISQFQFASSDNGWTGSDKTIPFFSSGSRLCRWLAIVVVTHFSNKKSYESASFILHLRIMGGLGATKRFQFFRRDQEIISDYKNDVILRTFTNIINEICRKIDNLQTWQNCPKITFWGTGNCFKLLYILLTST